MNRLIAGEIVDITRVETPYIYQEYPKWVTLADGSKLIVHNAEEERAAIGEETTVEAGYSNLRDALMAEAKALGLTPHHRCGEDKLRDMIDQAKGQ
jgi:hypothetical protein